MRQTKPIRKRAILLTKELRERAARTPVREDEIAEFMLDLFYLHGQRPMTKSDFIKASFNAFPTAGFIDSWFVMIRQRVLAAFDRLVWCGAIKYQPRKHILPGENE